LVLSADAYQDLKRSAAQPVMAAPSAWSGCWMCHQRRPVEVAAPSMQSSTSSAIGDRFLDASALIYLVDGDAFSAAAVKQQLLQLAATAQASLSGIRLAISRLSWLECREGPCADRTRRLWSGSRASSPDRICGGWSSRPRWWSRPRS